MISQKEYTSAGVKIETFLFKTREKFYSVKVDRYRLEAKVKRQKTKIEKLTEDHLRGLQKTKKLLVFSALILRKCSVLNKIKIGQESTVKSF